MDDKNTYFFCDFCDEEKKFLKVEIEEEVTVKGLTFNNRHIYYKCVDCDELFEPFDNPDINYISDYEKYCINNNMLTYKEIKNVRETYKLSQRDFAKLLAISHATISKIEKGQLPSEQHDVLFKLASDPYSFFHKIVKSRGHLLTKKVRDDLEEELQILMICSYDEHKKELEKFAKKMNDDNNDLKIRLNKIEITQSLYLDSKETQKEDEQIWKPTSLLKRVGLKA